MNSLERGPLADFTSENTVTAVTDGVAPALPGTPEVVGAWLITKGVSSLLSVEEEIFTACDAEGREGLM